jgi:hypothetical protein
MGGAGLRNLLRHSEPVKGTTMSLNLVHKPTLEYLVTLSHEARLDYAYIRHIYLPPRLSTLEAADYLHAYADHVHNVELTGYPEGYLLMLGRGLGRTPLYSKIKEDLAANFFGPDRGVATREEVGGFLSKYTQNPDPPLPERAHKNLDVEKARPFSLLIVTLMKPQVDILHWVWEPHNTH